MSYLTSSLARNEEIYFSPSISWVTYVNSIAQMATGIFFLIFFKEIHHIISLWNPRTWVIAGVLFLFFGIVSLLAVMWGNLNTEIAVTNKRILYKTGFLIRSIHEISLSKVEAVEIDQGLVDHMCDTGEVIVTGSGGTKIKIQSIDSPVTFRRIIAEHSNL